MRWVEEAADRVAESVLAAAPREVRERQYCLGGLMVVVAIYRALSNFVGI